MESEGVSQAATNDLEAAKQEARSMLEAGSSIEEIEAATGLGRNQILGISGAMKKARKKLGATEDKAAKGSSSENVGEEEITSDLRREAQITNSAVALARGQQRLKSLDPELYRSIHGSGQLEANSSRVLVDLETAKLIRAMRQEEEQQHRNNGDGTEASETALLRKELETIKEEMRKKDVEDLKGQIAELRNDVRHASGSGSDLAVVVKEASGLLEKIVESNGPLRAYLMPNNVDVRPRQEAPALQHQLVGDGRPSVASELVRHGLVTRVIQKERSA